MVGTSNRLGGRFRFGVYKSGWSLGRVAVTYNSCNCRSRLAGPRAGCSLGGVVIIFNRGEVVGPDWEGIEHLV